MADTVSKTLLFSTDLQQYIFDTSVYPKEHKQLKELREATFDKYSDKREFSVPVDEGMFLAMVVKLMVAKRTLEIGVFTGYSLLSTALATPDDGQITAIDLDREAYEVGLPFMEKAGVAGKINFVQSDAVSGLDELLRDGENEGAFDFVFVDADKPSYMTYHERILKLLRVGGVVAYDNTLWYATVAVDEGSVRDLLRSRTKQEAPEYFIKSRAALIELNRFLASDQRVEISQVSIGDGVTLCRRVSYGDGSFTVGNFVTETMTFGSSGKVDNVALGCGHDNEGLFVGAAGLLGLGGGPLSLTKQIKASSFSYCLVDRDSPRSSTLDFNSADIGAADTVTAPLMKNGKMDTFYYVGLTGVSVGGSPLSIPPSLFQMDDSGSGGIIVDSGTAVTRMQTEAYNSLRDAFVKRTQNLKSAGTFALFDTCYDFSSLSQVRVPTVAFHFAGDKSWTLPAKNYLIPVDSAGTFCFAFAPTSSPLSIIGNVQQQGTRVSFDLANSLVGFSANKC
ncbi:hypothetical protein SAY87_007785 [Trapa incisa]|uniref:Peptidase A1 domain-containing protein n=1 Tax=Trapa incisa TaxID=236973 RepID=A0AAN7QFB3_9MYRT|nr:hypothetical protein SAY87_007780 [Trapa incisa]KAK4766141.1 hypothetical protein SAY87_007783 [Trapa incisa]KAK4766143.1 hypothetical protein SAY87_007785 [Trapa incisa]